MPEKEEEGLIKCPGCDLRLPEDAVLQQINHMSFLHADIVEERQREAGTSTRRLASAYITLLEECLYDAGMLVKDQTHQHASCACVYIPGVYPLKTLCGLIITNNQNGLPKCPECLELFGKPCQLCPPGCSTCIRPLGG